MKNIFYFVVFILLFSLNQKAESQIVFQKTVRESQVAHFAYSVKRTPDNGYILSGNDSKFAGIHYESFYLVKSDSVGTIEWTKSYACIGSDNILNSYEALPTYDGGYILGGMTRIGNPNIYVNVGLIKTDSQGDTIWTRFFDVNGSETGTCFKQTPDSGFIVVGETQNTLQFDIEIYVIKIDKNGNVDWSKAYEPTTLFQRELRPISVDPTPDGGYFICGTISPGGTNLESAFLLKINSVGNIVFLKAYDSPSFDYASAGKITPDNGYIITGFYGPNLVGTFLLKTDSIGDIEWSKAYHPNDSCALYGFGVTTSNDHGYAITGEYIHYTDLNGGSFDKYCISQIKVDSIGNPQWSRMYGKPNTINYGIGIEQASDGGFMLAGTMNSYAAGEDVYMIKTDALGNSGCYEDVFPITTLNGPSITSNIILLDTITNTRSNRLHIVVGSGGTEVPQCPTSSAIETANNHTLFSVYPNPIRDMVKLKLNFIPINACVEVSNLSGKILIEEKINSSSDITLKVNLCPGIYFITVFDSKNRSTQKLIVQE